MSNIESFERAIHLALLRLYAAFPIPIEIDPISFGPANDSTEQAQQLQIHIATIEFLGSEGFVTFSPRANGNRIFRDCVLTAKGLTALNAMPKRLKGQESIIESLKSRGDIASDTAVKTFVSEAIKRFIGMYVGT